LIETLIDIIKDTTTPGSLYIRELAFNILANVCEDCRVCQKTLRRCKGIEVIRDNITLKQVDQSGNCTTFTIAVLDCLSKSVYGNKRSEAHFLDIEGLQVLLELIESCDATIKRMALSCLCTILENNKSF
jgi:hypothetical protein